MNANSHNIDIKCENIDSWTETDVLENQPNCNSMNEGSEECCSQSNTRHNTIPTNQDIKEELKAIPVEKVTSGKFPDAPKLGEVIVSKIKEEVKNEFVVSTYKNVNTNLFLDPPKPIEVIDIKIKEEIKDDLGTNACSTDRKTVDIEGMVQVKIEVKKEKIDTNPTSNYIKYTPTYKKRKRTTEYECSICLHRTFSKDALARHKEETHAKKEEEPYIKPPLSSFQASFEEHIKLRKIRSGPKLANNKKKFNCSRCIFQTESQYQFSKHSLQHNRIYRCTSCNFTTCSHSELNQHTLKHKNEKPRKPKINEESIGRFQCAECSYETFNENFLKEHVTLHKEPVNWAECPHCPYKTSYSHGLRFHLRLHEDPKDEEQKSPKHEEIDCTNEYRPIKTEFLEPQKKTTNRSKSRDLLRNLLLGQNKYLEGK